MEKFVIAFKELVKNFSDARRSCRILNEQGASTVEYALLIAVLVTGVVTGATVMFEPLQEFFKGVIENVKKLAGVS